MTNPTEARPIAWLCELMQEDGTTRQEFVTEDPDGLRWNDAGEPSPFKVTPLHEPPRWVPVDERLPPEGVRVLVYVPTCGLLPIQADEWNEQREDPLGMGGPTVSTGHMWDEHEFEEVTHWMPLPAAPAAVQPAPVICGNCDTALPEGCGGLFRDEGPACRLNHAEPAA